MLAHASLFLRLALPLGLASSAQDKKWFQCLDVLDARAGVSSRASYQDSKNKRKSKDLQVPDSQHFTCRPRDASSCQWMSAHGH